MLSALIGAGASLLGGFMGSKEKDKDRQMQKEFAQSGIQWKVADAKKAGVHPLYALGAQTSSFAPVSVGSSDLSTGIASAGQDIARAVHATSPAQTRIDAYDSAVRALTLDKAGLENDLLRSQIAKINATLTPAMPTATSRYLIDGQGSTALVDDTPLRRVAAAPEAAWSEPGAITDVGFARTANGGLAPVMSGDVKQRLEEDPVGMLFWNVRNRLMPTLGTPAPVPFPTNPVDIGHEWWGYNPFTQEYTKRTHRPYGFY